MSEQEHDFYEVDGRIDFERIRKICRESDFAKVNLMRQQESGYLSNDGIMLNSSLKEWLGMTDILDEEVYIVSCIPHHFMYNVFSGGFAITQMGIFSSYFNGIDNFNKAIYSISYVPFEDLAKAKTIGEGWPEYHMMSLQPQGAIYYRWLMADDKQIAFFVYAGCYGCMPVINLFCDIASSVRRDLGLGRVNILPNSQDKGE